MPRATTKKKEKSVKKTARKPAAKKTQEGVWIYGERTVDSKAFEFHPELQEFIEGSYKSGKKKCKVGIFSTVWTLDFEKMTASFCGSGGAREIKRVTKPAARRMSSLIGIQGLKNIKENSKFIQNDKMCYVCFYEATIPTRNHLCGHVFCFMCLKTNYIRGNDCPTCRGDISRDLVENPIRLDVDVHTECPKEHADEIVAKFAAEDGVEPRRRSERTVNQKSYWIYKADHRTGWYRYDPKTEKLMEESYIRRKDEMKVFICGKTMEIDFKTMKQKNEYGWGSIRNIKRISFTDIKKHRVRGIAGIDTVVYPIQ